MNTALGDALSKALKEKKRDFSSFVWKGEKIKDNKKYTQNVELMQDMSPERLQECYEHCQKMLYNDDVKNPGRYNVLDEIDTATNKCNVELFLRYCENSYLKNEREAVPRRTFYYAIRKFIENTNNSLKEEGKEEIEDWSNIPISEAANNLPEEFENISIEDVISGCIGYLGAFDKKHLTMTFITRMGLWLSKSEEGEFKGMSNKDKLKTIKTRLHLPEKLVLRFSDKGLSYHEMRAMLILPKRQKYSDMTTEQLITLRDVILLRYQNEVKSHIYNWKKLQKQLMIVAKYKGVILNDQN